MRPVAALIICGFWLGGCAGLADLPVVSGLLQAEVSRAPQALKPGSYRLDPAHASLTFSVDHMGLSRFTGRFDRLQASLEFDEAQPEAARLDVLVDMASLSIGDEDFGDTLLGPDWFDARAHPEARFTATAVNVTGENSGTVSGDLTLAGVTAPVTLQAVFNGGAQVPLTGAYTLGFDATGEIDRSAFGLGRFSGFVGDTVSIAFSGEFQRHQGD